MCVCVYEQSNPHWLSLHWLSYHAMKRVTPIPLQSHVQSQFHVVKQSRIMGVLLEDYLRYRTNHPEVLEQK